MALEQAGRHSSTPARAKDRTGPPSSGESLGSATLGSPGRQPRPGPNEGPLRGCQYQLEQPTAPRGQFRGLTGAQ